jgi:ADP-ribosylglycohydrolase
MIDVVMNVVNLLIKSSFFSLSARAESDSFDATIASAVGFLTSSESALVHSAVRARILRDLIRTDAPDAVSHDSSATIRMALVEKVIADYEDELVTAEWEAVVKKLPAVEVVAAGMSVWGESTPSQAFTAAVKSFGQACADPGNFQSSLLALVSCESYTEGVRRNLRAGGCNCSRANFLGACLGAAYGMDTANGIPAEWLARTDKGMEVLEMALNLLD